MWPRCGAQTYVDVAGGVAEMQPEPRLLADSAPGATFVDSRFDFADLSGEKLDGVVFEAGRHEAVGGRLDELFSLRLL